ncbi:MAG: DUF4908 domain-containing protein [Alphaproteobacteria bacterium]
MRASKALFLFLLCTLCTPLAFSGAPFAHAQEDPIRGLKMPGQPRPDLPEDGSYLAGDSVRFSLDRYRNFERLRISGDDEVFYLTIEPAALGGRVLKYDSGDVALKVAGWGGVTIYTSKSPGGIPAERLGDPAAHVLVLVPDVKKFAVRTSEELQDRTGLTIGFRANWDVLNASDETRLLAGDAIRNAARAIERVAATRRLGQALLSHFNIVRIAPANETAVTIEQKLLVISIAPSQGQAGRPSSLAIAQAIRQRLQT